jgi:hypothetical protein
MPAGMRLQTHPQGWQQMVIKKVILPANFPSENLSSDGSGSLISVLPFGMPAVPHEGN